MWRYFQNKKEEFVERILKPIPEEFYSFETGEPFHECIECGSEIGSGSSDYIIEKGYQEDEVVYEYALCEKCSKELSGELSKDSTRHLKKALRRPILKATIDGCRKCGMPRHDLLSYSIVGACLGQEMLFWNVPILICDPCLEEITEGLSKQTRDILDDFEERNFPGPPEMELDLPRPKRKVMLL